MKMRYWVLYIIITFSASSVFAQKVDEKKKKEILQRGFKLYYLEMASWISSDLISKEPSVKEKIGGYLSYFDHVYKTIFWEKGNEGKIIATVYYRTDISTSDAYANLEERDANKLEKELIGIREAALENIIQDTTGFFEFYENTSFNPIPLKIGNRKYVYLLTAPQVSGVVVFGNDYLLTYNSKNKLITREKLHNNIIILENDPSENDSIETHSSMHSHLEPTSEYITATDICTLLLYGDFTKWKQHYVVSKDFVSIWDIKSSSLVIVARKAWEQMLK